MSKLLNSLPFRLHSFDLTRKKVLEWVNWIFPLIYFIDCEFGWRAYSSNLCWNNNKCFEYKSFGSHSDIHWINFANMISLLLAKWNKNYTTTATMKMTKTELPLKISATVFQSSFDKLWVKLVVENLVCFWGGKVGRFWKLALIFFNSRVINMLFLFRHNYNDWECFVLINCQILRTDGKENPQQLVKRITC